MQGSSSPTTVSTQQQQHQKPQAASSSHPKQEPSFSPPLTSNNRLPDLMRVMFPSDDPLAYPNQPMSTLEDDHFKNEANNTPEQFAFGPLHGMQTAMSPTSYAESQGSMSLAEQNPNALLSHLNRPAHFSNQQDTAASSASPTRGQPHTRANSDIVTMTNQPSMWQDLDAQQLYGNQYLQGQVGGTFGHASSSSSSSQHPQGAQLDDAGVDLGFGMSGLDGFGLGFGTGMGMDSGNMGLGMNMDIDDFLRGTSAGNSGGDFPSDWTQWGNLDMNDPES